ncbi:MAG: amidase family protein [Pseudomonadota bacterium]
MTKTWANMTAAELGRDIAAGRVNPVELTEFFLDAIALSSVGDRIYARTTPDRARAEAMAANSRAKSGLRRGPLDGVPISWKDLFDTAGTATEAGSALLRGRTPEQDARVLRAATAAGLVCLGKTHMSELAFSGLGLNPVTATPPCLNDPRAVPGGSSSGAATSVAFGLAPAAIGSDTGGSVRIPSAWNDLVGLKTSAGRLPLGGTVPLATSFDTIGPIAHSVEDCALLLAALEQGTATDLRGADLSGLRLAVLETVVLDDLRDAPGAGFDDAVRRLSKAGAVITRLAAPEVAEALRLAAIVVTAEAYGIWRDTIEAAPDKMFRPILDRFRSGADYSAADYVASWRRLDTLRQTFARRIATVDAVILPTSPILPPDARRLLDDAAYYAGENLLALRNTRIANLLDMPVLTLPTARPSCGISFMMQAGAESRLLRLGAAAEQALR